jgi:hypothetical protein
VPLRLALTASITLLLLAATATTATAATARATATPAGPTAARIVRLPAAPVVSAWLRATGPGASLVAAGRRIPLRRGAAARIEAVRDGATVRVALGERRFRGPGRGGIRVVGPVRVRRTLATPRTTASLIGHRLLALEPEVRPGWAPDGSAPSGRIRRTRDWKRGFYAGALWRAIEAAPATRDVLEPVAWRATRALWGGEGEDTHDVGFIFGEASGGALRVGCIRPTADCRRAGSSLRRAAATLHRLAAATPAGVIPVQDQAGCRICRGDERKVYIDSAMNMTPLLEGTDADRALAARHLAFVARELIRPDGSTTQQLLLRASTGAVTRRLGHDPLTPASTWARGQAWAVRGYAEAAQAVGGPWTGVAERTADWASARADRAPGWDWALPRAAGNPLDTSAAAITAAGLERLIALRCGTASERCAAWERASAALIDRASEHVSDAPGRLGRFDGQRYLWDPSRRIDYRGEYLMGTDYLLEALAIRRGSSTSATTRSTASGRKGATAAAARSA